MNHGIWFRKSRELENFFEEATLRKRERERPRV